MTVRIVPAGAQTPLATDERRRPLARASSAHGKAGFAPVRFDDAPAAPRDTSRNASICGTCVDAPSQKPCSVAIRRRIAEGAEHQVEQRQVAVVERVQAALVVHRMAFGALHDVTQPARSADVGVLEDRQEGGDVQHHRRRLRRQADDHGQAQARQRGPADEVERTEPERAIGIQPLRAVVQLVEAAPQHGRVVHAAVPGHTPRLRTRARPPALLPTSAGTSGRTPGSAATSPSRTAAGTTTGKIHANAATPFRRQNCTRGNCRAGNRASNRISAAYTAKTVRETGSSNS